MHENEIARIIVDVAYKIHKKLGPGLLDSVYEIILVHELKKWACMLNGRSQFQLIMKE